MKVKRIHRKKTLTQAANLQETVYDPFRDFQGSRHELLVAKFFYYVRENFKQVLLGLVIVTVGLASYVVYDIYKKNREEKALLAYEQLLKNPVMTGAADVSAAAAKLDEYMTAYPVVSAKRRAILKKISLYENAGRKKDAALQALEATKILDAPSLRLFMYAKAAALFEDEKEYGRMLEACEQGLKLIQEDGQIRASLMFAQARALKDLGKPRDAEETLKSLLKMDEKSHPEMIPVKQAAIITLLDESGK